MNDSLKFILLACLVILLFGLIIYLLRRLNKPVLKQIILGLVVKAEKYLGSGTGSLKKATVISWIYSKVPPGIRWMFTENDLSDMIEWAVKKLKDSLSDGTVNLSGYDDEIYLSSISNK